MFVVGWIGFGFFIARQVVAFAHFTGVDGIVLDAG
jgi:hypothetical protein